MQAEWTGRGDVGDVGTPVRWVVVASQDTSGGVAHAPGVEEWVQADFLPSGLTACTYYDVDVRVIGQHNGFLSSPSNTVYGQTCCTLCEQELHGGGGESRAQVTGQVHPLALAAPRPNPARGGTRIRWSIPRERAGERFQIAVFDVAGRKVATVVEGDARAGSFSSMLGPQAAGSLTRGVYFLRLQIGRTQLTRSLILTE